MNPRTFALLLIATFVVGTAAARGLYEYDGHSSASRTVDDSTPEDARTVAERADGTRIVSLGAAVTEIVFALGLGDQVVGVDYSSTYPPAELASIPKAGYVRQLSAETVLALDPTVVISSIDIAPGEVVTQLDNAGVPVFIVPEDDSIEGVRARIEFVSEIAGVEEAATSLTAQIDSDLERARSFLAGVDGDDPVSVMFIYSHGPGATMVSGTDTAGHVMIDLAGGRNAVTGYSDYQAISPEATIAADPDVILLTDAGMLALGGIDGIGTLPGFRDTRAYQERRIVTVDSALLLGFGPRVGEAVLELSEALYPPAP